MCSLTVDATSRPDCCASPEAATQQSEAWPSGAGQSWPLVSHTGESALNWAADTLETKRVDIL